MLGNLSLLGSNMLMRAFVPGMPILIGGFRPVEVLLPDNYDPSVAAPLVVILPGYTDDRYEFNKNFKLLGEAANRGFIALSPNGIRNSLN
jgi:hypothetical protein